MKTHLITKVSAVFIFAILIFNCSSKDNSLKSELEESWKNYLLACKSGKESELEKVMSSYRFASMKNNLISANRSFTSELITSIADNAPDISKADFEDLIENGSTAGLIYSTDSIEKDEKGDTKINFIFIKFVKEEGDWKVDGMMEIGSPKLLPNGKRTKFDLSELPPTYEIDGKVLPAPKPIAPPEISALLDIFASGYKINVAINGNEQAEVTNSSYSGFVIGGIKKMKNKILIAITTIDKNTQFDPSVTVRCVIKDEAKACFKFEPKQKIEGTHEFNFDAE